jgi:hypothetical protein
MLHIPDLLLLLELRALDLVDLILCSGFARAFTGRAENRQKSSTAR